MNTSECGECSASGECSANGDYRDMEASAAATKKEWNRTDDLFINSVKVQIAKCVRNGTTFSANNWTFLRKSLSIPKELMVTRLKKLRAKDLLFKQLLAEEHVSYSHETGILSLPNYFWEDGINEVKYADFKKERNFQSLKE